ncbi:DMT family transporter [Pseudomonas panipatensis]|uniref:EamA-like transporter family protein n=1 Tax=Pseudomonas panipatensis TaxID=428992 RepID=A0A1G8GFT1_9PSED|nr:DMT family transporter [Pseudomonas panipatensis]SDH93252.1 EamA-like transporter family protein [Pseudomonas panipatensis]SMP43472.1 EamA-like transporter family protein [Pseudomonas panipatensis]
MSSFNRSSLANLASTGLFVLLWSSAAIASKWGLAHASPFVFLIGRFAIALLALLALGPLLGLRLPRQARERRQALLTGLVLLGFYPIFYLLALDLRVTPGVIATLLGVQPILTGILLERRFSATRLSGLSLGLGGLVLVVYQSIGFSGLTVGGLLCGLLALFGITVGTLLQKGLRESPLGSLPLQYAAGLLLCLALAPTQPLRADWSLELLLTLLWMGLVISVGATLLLYRLIARGNLVQVTSLFYLVPAVTALLDYLVFGNRLGGLALLGMGLIVVGLLLVFRQPRGAADTPSREGGRAA